jgi:hypothetical protein
VTHANFFFGSQGQLSFAVSDDLGVLRLYDYSPHREYYNIVIWTDTKKCVDPDSNNGLRLICSSEFHTHVPHQDVLSVSRKADLSAESDAMEIQSLGVESSLIFGEIELQLPNLTDHILTF